MTDVVLLCSYQFNQYNGYQEAYVDMKDRRLWAPSQKPELFPKPVVDFFSMAGSEAVCGYDDESKKYFFLVKYMDVMHRDEAGRKVYINIAFLSDRMDEMQNLTDGFCAQYKAVEKAFAGLLVLDVSGALSYSIDFDLLSSVMESCIALGKAGEKKVLPIFYSEGKPISFAVVKPSWSYFAKENDDIPPSPPSSVAYTAITTPDEHFSSLLQNTHETLYPMPTPEPPTPEPPTPEPDDGAQLMAEFDLLKEQLQQLQTEVVSLKEQTENLTKPHTKAPKDKLTFYLLIAAVILSILAVILSFASLSKKGDPSSWQTSSTVLMYQSSDTLPISQP